MRNVRLWRKCVVLSRRFDATTTNAVAVASRVHSPIVISTAAAAPIQINANQARPGSSGSHDTNGCQKWSL